MKKLKNYKKISIICLLISISVWIPNIIFQIPAPFWMTTFLIAPIGILFAFFTKKSWLILANTAMFFSFFIFMFAGYQR
ncbi:hypothetical protein [Oceanobacillus longus]|uniref:hypothetical protein n=1 Tax=Oceanobacillus longus TaxID=930120 RepID=UPI0036D2782F